MIANAIQSQPETHMRRRPFQLGAISLIAAALFACTVARAATCGRQEQQNSSQSPSSQPPASRAASGQSQDQKPAEQRPKTTTSTSTATTDNAPYDPFHAQQDVEVGKFYMNKGDVDAAIPRFEDAIRLRENFAQPRLLLAECYEKKHNPRKALAYYQEYLKVFPDAPDRKKVEKRIDRLSK